MDARRAERSPDEPKIPRFCWMTSLEYTSFGLCDHRMSAQRRGINSRFNRVELEVKGGKVEPAREVSTCTDSSTRSEQISLGDELDRGMCDDEVVGGDESI